MNIIPFNFESKEIRVVEINNEPWFVATDVCAVLGFSNARQAVNSHVDQEDVQKLDTPTNGGTQKINYVNESGLYALIFGSTLETAKVFKRFVTSDVLPSIRKTGSYQSKQFKIPATLSEALRDARILMSGGNRHNLPYQEYIERGYFEVTERTYEVNYETRIAFTPLITGKGQQWLTGRLIASGILKAVVAGGEA